MADSHERLSIGYLVPGHHLVSTAGPTRNVLSLARALAAEADVTVAFRTTRDAGDAPSDLPFEVLELDPGGARPARASADDAAIRGIGVGELARYLKTLRRFVREHDFDVVLEKSWIFSGYLGQRYAERGIPTALVENVVRVWSGSLLAPADWPRLARHVVSQRLVRHYVRSLALVIAETPELERAIRACWELPVERVEVVGLGVDHDLFRPGDRAAARSAHGIDPEALVLLYTGVLDRMHDLGPVIRGLARLEAPPAGSSGFALHVVGDGELRAELAALAERCRWPVVFHGRVPHRSVPSFLAAADLCLAPYDLSTFPGGEVAYSTLKIPEYMACARPVATVPAGHTSELIRDGESGFLLGSAAADWERLLAKLPGRARLDAMGLVAAEGARALSWEHTAAGYADIARRLAGGARRIPSHEAGGEAPQQA